MECDFDAAYAAGPFDGEGSVTLTRNHPLRWPSPQVPVASNDREVLEWLQARFGGVITTKKPRLPTHSVSFDWKLTDRKALAFLGLIRPYLPISPQATARRVAADRLTSVYTAKRPLLA
jgi:hypothetical protein